MAEQYYRVGDLHTIMLQAPETYSRIKKLAECAEHLRTVISATDTSMHDEESIIFYADLIDLLEQLRPAYAELQTSCRKYTKHSFFLPIKNYNLRSTKYRIALTLYADIKAMER